MQCIGYDAAFQRNLAEIFPAWVPPPPKSKSEKKKLDRKKQNTTHASKRSSEKRKREALQTTDSELEISEDIHEDINPDNHEEKGDSGPIYIARGTRSRPITA